jgi:beta-mannosidase
MRSWYKWVGERTWIYETTFSVPEYLRQDQKRRIALVMEGLDTFATVTLNGWEILKSSNMFLTHRVDITEQIRAASGKQTLRIVFDKVEEKGDKLVQQHPEHNWMTLNSSINRLVMRKAQYHWVTVLFRVSVPRQPANGDPGMGLGSEIARLWTLEADIPRIL